MAKKRLNKKVALIGSMAFVILGVVAVLAILHLSQDPQKFIIDGDAAMKAADGAADEQIKEQGYEKAERNYHRARARAKSDSLRIEILFKLVDLYLKIDKWNGALGCWNKIVQIDPKNVKARYALLKYLYIVADNYTRAGSDVSGVWKDIASQASDFIEVADANLLAEDRAGWESFEIREKEPPAEKMGSYLYLLKGRANLEMARHGAVTDPNESLTLAVGDLNRVLEFEPHNINASWYLAQAAITKGEISASKGDFEERDKAAVQAKELLARAVEVAVDDPKAHINLLSVKTLLAQMGDVGLTEEKIQSIESEYLALVERFDSSPEVFSALAALYLQLGHRNLDEAIEAIEKAIELDEENATYARVAADLHYRRFSVYKRDPELYKAIEIAQNALMLPGAQETTGPQSYTNKINRLLLYIFLANCYIEQVVEPSKVTTIQESRQWLTKAEEMVHEIEQLSASGEELHVVKWRGMLELAAGDKSSAVRKLYATYEQLKASGRRDAQLSYTLAKIFKDTAEVGAVQEFLASALSLSNRSARDKIDNTKPEAVLDYADVLLKLRVYDKTMGTVDFFENKYGVSERSRALRIKAYIGSKQFDQAEQEMDNLDEDAPDTVKLNLALVQAKIKKVQQDRARSRVEEGLAELPGVEKEPVDVELERKDELMKAELNRYSDALFELIEKVLPAEPGVVDGISIAYVCDNYIAQGKTGKAAGLVNRFLKYFPDNTTALFYKRMLLEPEPGNISQQRRTEIEREAMSDISNPVHRAVNLGLFYERHNELDKAAIEFKKALKTVLVDAAETPEAVVAETVFDSSKEIADLQRLAVGYLFEVAHRIEDFELAEQIVDLARLENLDDCQGQFFAARLAEVKQDYKQAMELIEQCFRKRPVFAKGFMLRSNLNAAIGNKHAAIEDARKAAALNPLDKDVARSAAIGLYNRNQELADNVSSEQIIETRAALDRAVALNTGQVRLQLLSLYAEFISATEPDRALAIRQRLQRLLPNVENAMLLGRMAMRMALNEVTMERKEAFFAIAESSFEQAMAIEPQNRAMLASYAEYYRLIGQQKKAEQLLERSQDDRLLWRHYFRAGRFEDAKGVLQQLYRSDPKDANVVRPLLLIAQKTADKQAVQRYSQELLDIHDSVENNLTQVQAFLGVGLVKEAEYKLQSFREKFPDEPRALLLEAWLTMRQGQLEKALLLTNRSLESDPDNALAWRLRGEMNRLTASYDQAISDLKKSKLLADEPLTRIALAKAYLMAGREEDAITELKNTIDNPQAPMESGLLLERIYWRLGKKEQLRRFYDETLARFPDNLLWYNRAGSFAITVGEFGRAEQLYEQAWQKGLKNGNAMVSSLDGYLQALILGGKEGKVIEASAKYVDTDFAPLVLLRMAEAKLKLGNRADAVKYCRRAVDKAGTNETFAARVLEMMYSLLGTREVSRYCKERLQAEPDSPSANWTMFNLAKTDGQYNKAVGYIDKCIQIAGPNNPHRFEYIMEKAMVLTMAYSKTSDNNYLKRAVTEYESLLAKMPNNTSILNNLAYMLAEENMRLPEALEYAKRAYEIRPNNPGILDTYSYVLYKNGRFAEADELLQAAIQQYEQDKISVSAEVYEHLGMIKEELGSMPQALAAYEQALEIGADTLPESVKERLEAAVERLSR